MGSHRAEPHGPRRRSSAPEQAPTAETQAYVGRRVAGREAGPVSSARIESATTHFDTESTVVFAAVGTPAGGGRRRAATRTHEQSHRPRLRSSAPLLLGIAALAVAAGGAVSTAHAAGTHHHASHSTTAAAATATAPSFTGGDVVGLPLFDRTPEVSRSSVRVSPSQQAKAQDLVAARDVALAKIDTQAAGQDKKIAENLWGLPIPRGVYHLTARFGDYGLWASFHTGLDFACPTGTPIHAIADGVITFTAYDGSYGNKTVELLPDGTELWYAHQNEFGATVGEKVTEGEVIGYVGSTGNTTGPHVHIEVRPDGGDPVDPFPEFVEHGITP